MSKNKVDQLRPYRNGQFSRHISMEKMEVPAQDCEHSKQKLDLDKIDLSKVNFSMQGNSGVQRLLRHLKRAKLEQAQQIPKQGGDYLQEPGIMSKKGSQNKMGIMSNKYESAQNFVLGQVDQKLNLPSTGSAIGEKYSQKNTHSRKLSFADSVTRKQRELSATTDARKKPPVGHYQPKFGQIENRPKSMGMQGSKRKLFL